MLCVPVAEIFTSPWMHYYNTSWNLVA